MQEELKRGGRDYKPLHYSEKLLIQHYLSLGMLTYYIAEKIGRSYSTVYGEIRNHGGLKNYKPTPLPITLRNVHNNPEMFPGIDPDLLRKKKFSQQDKLIIKTMLEQGFTYSDIAKELKRHPSSVHCHIITYGGKDNYDPPLKPIFNREESLSLAIAFAKPDECTNEDSLTPQSDRIEALEQKISMLEMQIDILLETIRKQ